MKAKSERRARNRTTSIPTSSEGDLVLTSVRPWGEEPTNLVISGGLVAGLGIQPLPEVRTIDCRGGVLMPAFVNAHAHLDKAMLASAIPNDSGTLAEARERMKEAKAGFTIEDIRGRARRAILQSRAFGVTGIRTHVDVDSAVGLRGIDALVGLKEELAPSVDLQIVAFPQEGLAGNRDTYALMREALVRGADVVGGHLSIADSPTALRSETDDVFRLAIEFDRDIDVHVDLDLDRRAQYRRPDRRLGVVYLSERTIAEGFENRVTASHVSALGEVDPSGRKKAIDLMARAGVSAVVLPASNLYVQGRNDPVRVRRGVAPLLDLLDGGVRVAVGTDNIRDPFNPFSSADPMLHATVTALACHLVGLTDYVTVLRLLTVTPSSILGTGAHDLSPGSQADLVIFDSQSIDGLLDGLVNRFRIFRRGRSSDFRTTSPLELPTWT